MSEHIARGQPIIEVSELRREFVVRTRKSKLRRTSRVVVAVDDLTFSINAGQRVGYIGANGAGKSTTIKMLTGILVPTSGQVRVCGMDPVRQRRELSRRIGVVFGQRSQLWWDLPLVESFRVLAAMHGRPDVATRERLEECVELLDMSQFMSTPVRQLSLGQRMRGEVCAALLHEPELLILDEPTIGLDLLSKERLRSYLAATAQRDGTTVLLTTHDLPDIERLCERILTVDHGRLVYDGDLAGLRERVGAQRVLVVEFDQPAAALDAIDGTTLEQVLDHGMRQELAFSATSTTAAAVIAAVTAAVADTGVNLVDLSVREPDIEDVVRRLYEQA